MPRVSRRHIVGVWATLILLPVVPVVIFYVVFAEQNYFELNDTARGVVTTGPIAAYFALVYLGWRIYLQVSSLIAPLDPMVKRLVGTSWHFTATSYHGTNRQGAFTVSEHGMGDLRFSGKFQDPQGRDVGDWRSTMTHCENKEIQVLYTLRDLSKEREEDSTGMLRLQLDDDTLTRMTGNWVVVGRGEAHGDLVCTQDAK